MDDPTELAQEVAEAAAVPDRSDERVIVGQTGQNVVGLVVGAIALFAAQILMSRRLGADAFGVVTATTQFAFIAAAATRFGMDVANVRLVAILMGRGQGGRARGLVRRSYVIAGAVSLTAGVAVFLGAPWLAERFSGLADEATPAFRWAAVTIPLAALAFTAMGATRGLKIMRYTLYAQWFAQPIGWVVLTLMLWAVVAPSAAGAGAAFACAWGAAMAIAAGGWLRERRRLPHDMAGAPISEERTGSLLRFGALRAPGTLFAQLIFFADFYVISVMYAELGSTGADQVGVYGGVLRAGQSLFLFLTSVSLTFSPFVADLHHRGERERLDVLYKRVTRWALAATIPVLTVLAVLPGPVLRVFGEDFTAGDQALRILIVGMIVPVMVGTVGFILIMAGRTGWDLLVYVGGVALDVGLALALARPEVLGIRGAAVAQACTLTASAVARLFLVRRFLGIWPFDGAYLRLIVPALLGAVAMAVVHELMPASAWLLSLVAAAAVGTLVYGVALLVIGLPDQERAKVRTLVRRGTGRRGPGAASG
jgi:O-antigen/teichoic acid export membrane protein